MFGSVASDIRHITFEGVIAPRSRLTHPDSSPSALAAGSYLPSEAVDELSTWLLDRAGVNPAAYRASCLLRRVPACLRQLRVSSSAAALSMLHQDDRPVPAALDVLLIGFSGFFRDSAVFSALESSILPALLTARDGQLRVLSAGASTGQELYSVAMLLEELGASKASALLGIDCRPGAIQKARLGCYEADELDGLSAARRERFLLNNRTGSRICPELRARLKWQVSDALSFHEPDPSDLILFRNVAIYLERSHADRAWARLTDQLRPGGILVTGKAEAPPTSLGYERIAPCLFRRRGP